MSGNFLESMKNPSPQIQEVQLTPSKINEKKLISRHIRVELKSNRDPKTLKAAREKRNDN